MTQSEFNHLLESSNTLSPEQIQILRRELDSKLAAMAGDDERQRRLFAAGLLSEIKPPITDLTAYSNRKAVPIQGEPLSETVIRERR